MKPWARAVGASRQPTHVTALLVDRRRSRRLSERDLRLDWGTGRIPEPWILLKGKAPLCFLFYFILFFIFGARVISSQHSPWGWMATVSACFPVVVVRTWVISPPLWKRADGWHVAVLKGNVTACSQLPGHTQGSCSVLQHAAAAFIFFNFRSSSVHQQGGLWWIGSSWSCSWTQLSVWDVIEPLSWISPGGWWPWDAAEGRLS